MGLAVVALSLLGIYVLYIGFGQDPLTIIGFGFGASLAALFAQLGGGIYTKAADVGADLVGKIEAGIPEDDPRNPAVIADLVGDNVGDCAGRSADLFESITAENIAAMILGLALLPSFGVNGVIFPLVIRGAGLIATIFAVMFVRAGKDENPMNPMWRGLIVNTALCAIFFYFIVNGMLGDMNLFYAVLVGLATNLFIGVITDYYTSYKYRPVKEIAESSETGTATNIITGYAVSLEATALPVIVLSIALLTAFYFGNLSGYGIFGTAVATMGMLAPTAFILAMDGFGPVADNAGGIVEMYR
jgi:K(+)-stimulated pyrophosphate-energized sodium pump